MIVVVKVLDVPKEHLGESRVPEQTEELRALLEAGYPGRFSLAYVDLRHDLAERETCAGMLAWTGRYPAPIVVIDGQARFSGKLRLQTVVKAVGRVLERGEAGPSGLKCPA